MPAHFSGALAYLNEVQRRLFDAIEQDNAILTRQELRQLLNDRNLLEGQFPTETESQYQLLDLIYRGIAHVLPQSGPTAVDLHAKMTP